jgi:hypothetical protein
MLSSVTPLEIALITPAVALVGVALGIVGNGYLDRLRDRRTAKRERDQAIAELLTATVNLTTGAQAVRVAYHKQTRRRHFIRVSAVLMAAIGSAMRRGETLSSDLLQWNRLSPAFDRILAEDRQLVEGQRTAALDVATVLGPRMTRFYAAVAVLTLGEDKEIADAVRNLANSVGAFVEVIAARQRKYDSARDRVGKALREFRRVADRRPR